MIETQRAPERAFLVAVEDGRAAFDVDRSLDELATLVRTAGAEVVGRSAQRRSRPDPATYLGKGKVSELLAEKARARFDLLVADDELSPSQRKKLEERLDVRVIDRSAVILDIFAKHAQSHEGRLQVELAQLQYRLPRLAGIGRELSRLGGGINTRGPGETKLESDRQIIRRRITDIRRRIEDVRAHRERARRSRDEERLFLASLVGYTNAGKSTLMNALTGADVLVADQPFATLDPTTRRLELGNGRVMLLSDTVGFIQKLPPALVAAFRATLEELGLADVLVHVADVASPELHAEMRTVDAVLAELGLAERPRLVVFNKLDLLSDDPAKRQALASEFPAAHFASARTGEGLMELRDALRREASAGWRRVRVTIPYELSALLQRVRERGALLREEYGEAGITLEANVPSDLAGELRERSVAGRRA
ncbi:MAG TPA: GTPase HflX [Candidatus Dormibacteraeota bacterium]|nr:GTPase HflX [Candidatus Dormibacteraeota bacterium]